MAAAAAAAEPAANAIAAGLWALLKVEDERQTQIFTRIEPGATIATPRLQHVSKLSLAPLIGAEYGTVWEYDPAAKSLRRIAAADAADAGPADAAEDPAAAPAAAAANKDNRALRDDNQAQTATAEELQRLRSAGATGDDLVKACIEGSTTFASKTAFSQEKYIRKKQRKWAFRFAALRPTVPLIVEYYAAKKPERTLQLRVDTLAQMLHQGNVHAHARTLVVETCAGVVTSAVVQRQGGHGKVYNITHGSGAPQSACFDWLGLAEQAERTLRHVPLEVDPLAVEPAAASVQPRDHRTVLPAAGMLHELLPDGASSLVVCSNHCPSEVFRTLLPLLGPGCCIAVYGRHPEPLHRLSGELRAERLAVNVLLTETWWREYQVLPERTHPHVWMNAASGWILSAQVVENDDERWRRGAGRPSGGQAEPAGGAAAASDKDGDAGEAKRRRTD